MKQMSTETYQHAQRGPEVLHYVLTEVGLLRHYNMNATPS